MMCVVVASPMSGKNKGRDVKTVMQDCMATQISWRNDTTGVWETAGWWNSANVLTALIEYIRVTEFKSLLPVVDDVFEKARHYKVGVDSLGNDRFCDNFANDFYDDRGWWALAWVDAYRLTGKKKYLDMAETIFWGMTQGWTDELGGGIYWKRNPHKYKNAIANNLFGLLAARLLKCTQKAEYRTWLDKEVAWMLHSGMLNRDSFMVEDGLTQDGTPNRKQHYTYNQGVLMAVLTEMFELTGEKHYIEDAHNIAAATMRNLTTPEGILRERRPNIEPSGDGVQFKGVFIRHLSYLNRVSPKKAYKQFILKNAQSIVDNDYDEASCSLGCYWYGPFHKVQSAANGCALECLIAAQALSKKR